VIGKFLGRDILGSFSSILLYGQFSPIYRAVPRAAAWAPCRRTLDNIHVYMCIAIPNEKKSLATHLFDIHLCMYLAIPNEKNQPTT